MKKYFAILILILAVTGCSVVGGSITTQTHPNSKIVMLLEQSGLDAESTGRTIADIVVMEIQLGKFSRAKVLKYIDDRIEVIEGNITYYRFVRAIEDYAKVLIGNKNEIVSQSVIIGYMLFKRSVNLSSLRIKANMVMPDKELILQLLRFVRSEVVKYT